MFARENALCCCKVLAKTCNCHRRVRAEIIVVLAAIWPMESLISNALWIRTCSAVRGVVVQVCEQIAKVQCSSKCAAPFTNSGSPAALLNFSGCSSSMLLGRRVLQALVHAVSSYCHNCSSKLYTTIGLNTKKFQMHAHDQRSWKSTAQAPRRRYMKSAHSLSVLAACENIICSGYEKQYRNHPPWTNSGAYDFPCSKTS